MSTDTEDRDAIEELIGPNPDYSAQSPDDYGESADDPEGPASPPAKRETTAKKNTPPRKSTKKQPKGEEEGSADEPGADLADLGKDVKGIIAKLDDLLYYSEQHRVGVNSVQDQVESVAELLIKDIPKQINAANEGVDTATKDLLRAASTTKKRRREPSKVVLLASALLFTAVGAAGAYVLKPTEVRIKEVPVEKQTSSENGWKDAIWEHHGQQIIDCYRVARQRGKVMPCSFAVK